MARRVGRTIGQAAALLLLAAAAGGAADESPALLATIRQHMAENLARLPNYTCRETIERTGGEAGTRHLAFIDRLRVEVAYVGGRELYALPGEDHFEDRPLDEIVGPGGAISTGDFATHARVVFTTNAPAFTWAGEEQRDGRTVVRYDFRVPLRKSGYAIRTGARPVVVAYDGFVLADRDTLDPLQLEVHALDLPAELKLRDAWESIRYAEVRIAGTPFLLPESAELSMTESKGFESRNLTRFEQCREYAGESIVRFDVGEDGGGAASAAEPIVLPPKLSIEAILRDPIDWTSAARGDLVYLVVGSAAKRSGRVLVPKGALITGRITQLVLRTLRGVPYFGVALKFHAVAFGGRHGDFSASVQTAGILSNFLVDSGLPGGISVVWVKSNQERIPAGTRVMLQTR